jgi:hypothetical protein
MPSAEKAKRRRMLWRAIGGQLLGKLVTDFMETA